MDKKTEYTTECNLKYCCEMNENLVEVVRCKNCKYALIRTKEEMNKPVTVMPILCERFTLARDYNDFCNYGEAR